MYLITQFIQNKKISRALKVAYKAVDSAEREASEALVAKKFQKHLVTHQFLSAWEDVKTLSSLQKKKPLFYQELLKAARLLKDEEKIKYCQNQLEKEKDL